MSLSEYIPEPLRGEGPWNLQWWQWIGLVTAIVLAIVVGRTIARFVYWGVQRLVGRTETKIDDLLVARIAGPMRLLGSIACARILMPFLELPSMRASTVGDILLTLFGVALVWSVLRAIDVLIAHYAGSWGVERPTSRALLSLVGKTAKVVVFVFAAISLLGAVGLPVGSLLAGLGLGGIALAFGAQKTVENLFGAFAIGIDQPLREGDFVAIDSTLLGTVETVGLRSTRVRTLDRSVVTLPNGRLADMKIETFAPRDRCRLAVTIGLVYQTTSTQLDDVLAGFDRVIREHPRSWKGTDGIVVRLMSLGPSALELEVVCSFVTNDWDVFRACRHDVLLGFMRVVEAAGTAFAYPTQTVHLAKS
jgi:MscS family membrane protein